MSKEIELHLAPGQDHLTITQLEGSAPAQLGELAPIKCDIKGTLQAVAEYLAKRVNAEQFQQKDCHILINRDKGTIHLIFNEKDPYNRGEVLGKLEVNPKFEEFGINNMDKVWTPATLGMFFKMNRPYFVSKEENMKLVSELMHFTATVNSYVDNFLGQNGDRAEAYNQAVNSNLPEHFMLRIPVLKGGPDWEIDVETFAKISGKDVQFILISPDAADLLEEAKFHAINIELDKIQQLAPDIAIIEE